jgi:hypothetical protein
MASFKLLDLTGLTHFWEKSKTYINDADTILKDSKIGYINVSDDGTLEFWNFAPEYNDSDPKEIINGATKFADVSELLGEALKDGMLSNVTIVTSSPENPIKYDKPEPYTDGTKFIEFTWNSDVDGDPETEEVDIKKVYLKVDEIGKVYQGSETITIDDTTNTISVSEVDDSQIKVSNFKVGGTPLGEYLKSKGVSEIKTDGQNLEEVLKALFSDETYPASSITYPTALNTVTVGKPTISITNQTSNIAMAGTKGTLSAGSNGSSTNATITYSGFDYGYSDDNDSDADGTSTPSNVTVTGVAVEGENYSLSFVTNNGFGGETIDAATGTNGAAVTTSKELEYALGTNKVTVTVTSPSYSATVSKQPAKYIVSSLGATSESEVVDVTPTKTEITAASNKNTNSITVTGVYPCYSNNGTALTAEVNTQLPLANSKVFVYDYVAETVTQHAMFACPSNRTCTVRIYNTLSSQFEDYAGFSKTGTESKAIGSLTVTYDIYTNNATSTDKYDATKYEFTLSKSTSEA